MQIDKVRFQQVFTARAQQMLCATEESKANESCALPEPKDDVVFSKPVDPLAFQSAVSAFSTAASLGGIPALAALTQEVAQALIGPQDEEESAQKILEQLSTLPRVQDNRVDQTWSRVAEATASPYSPPEVVDSFFIDAQADARNMLLGTTPLKQDLADDNVLAFTLAHEEAHRQNRDSAGSAGLETLVELCKDDEGLFPIAFKALGEGRRQNEREADLFAAEVAKKLNYQLEPILKFLESLPGDLQHPPGSERAELVKTLMSDSRQTPA